MRFWDRARGGGVRADCGEVLTDCAELCME